MYKRKRNETQEERDVGLGYLESYIRIMLKEDCSIIFTYQKSQQKCIQNVPLLQTGAAVVPPTALFEWPSDITGGLRTQM